MGELSRPEGDDLIRLWHDRDMIMPKPFERDIFLFETHIAGTTHIRGIEQMEPGLSVNDRLDFFREPNNQYDAAAVVIRTADGVKLGYVPQRDNIIFSRLMDAGKLLFGRISNKEIIGKWVKIGILVFLHE